MLLGELRADSGRLALVLALGCLERTQRVVPVGFERVGDEPVVGVDGEVAAAGELGTLACALDVTLPQLVGFISAGFELGLDVERDLEARAG